MAAMINCTVDLGSLSPICSVDGRKWMPIYEYVCKACGEEFEQIVGFSDPAPPCPACKSEVDKKISLSAFHLKGGGWYSDAYSGKGNSATGSSSSSGSVSGSASGTSKSSSSESSSSDSSSSDSSSSDSSKSSSGGSDT